MYGTLGGIVMVVLGAVAATGAQAQDANVDKLTVPFSDPARPGKIHVGVLNGGIRVTGYEGKEVLLEARVRDGDSDADEDHDDEESVSHSDSRSSGMRRLRNTATGLVVEEEDNSMVIAVETMSRTVDITLKVPRLTSLELNTVNDGDISVDGVEGEIEVNNTNGAVTLNNVSGSVVAHALNEDVIVRFIKVDPKRSMSFSSMNGNIDVTLPTGTRGDLWVKADNGEVFTDFDVQLDRRPPRVEEDKEKVKGKKYRVRIDHSITGTLNGGGSEFRFETFNGNVYIRKK